MANQKLFDASSIRSYLEKYRNEIEHALTCLEEAPFSVLVSLLRDSFLKKGRIFVAGNGGSASIAEHLSCDFSKGTAKLNVISLTSNTALTTALANDEGYEHIFERQLKMQNLTKKDTVILISSSGNSPNIVNAASYASGKCPVIGFSGFDGGRLKELADVKFHIPIHNYGLVEDCHQIIMHIITQWIMTQEWI